MGRLLTQVEFIEKAVSIHGNRYDYSNVEYKGNLKNIKIICLVHGEFNQRPTVHLNQKSGCPKCYYDVTQNDFINQATHIHKNEYDYSQVRYINNRIRVKIICKHHGIFEQRPDKHLKGQHCPKCQNRYQTTLDFISKASDTHGGRYDYSKSNYIDSETKVIIQCEKHGEFLQIPRSHVNGRGCPNCQQSQGENKIVKWLEDNKVDFNRQKKFNECKHKKVLPFDFYLPDYNICVEFDGKQHEIGFWRSRNKEKDLALTKIKDDIKNNYCLSNKIRLIRIPYNFINDIPIILAAAIS